jgi:hypothetical protein
MEATHFVRIATTCAHSEGLFRGSCGRAAVGECVYCGKPFCERHGEEGADYTFVCDRKTCRAKFEDVQAHQQWKRRVYESNRISICAHEGCEERMRHICSRCRLLFCTEHVSEHAIVTQSALGPPRKEMAVICVHCRERRKLWD